MNGWFYLLLIPALLCLIWFWPVSSSSRTALRRQSDSPTAKQTANQFHAVSIQPCKGACSAAKALRGQRFLAREAKTLPLADCNVANCQCTYRHYADRRAGEERRRASIAMRERFSKYEQRHGGDRRRRHAYQ